MKLQRGDIFCTTSNQWISKAIRGVESFWATDGEAKYSHSGIIIGDDGETIEALSNGIKRQNFFKAYKGNQVLIARLLHTCKSKTDFAIEKILKEHEGKIYPWWVLGQQLFPPLAKIRPSHMLVCSELVAEYLYLAGEGDKHYLGVTPDIMADRIINYKNYVVLFQGKLD